VDFLALSLACGLSVCLAASQLNIEGWQGIKWLFSRYQTSFVLIGVIWAVFFLRERALFTDKNRARFEEINETGKDVLVFFVVLAVLFLGVKKHFFPRTIFFFFFGIFPPLIILARVFLYNLKYRAFNSKELQPRTILVGSKETTKLFIQRQKQWPNTPLFFYWSH